VAAIASGLRRLPRIRAEWLHEKGGSAGCGGPRWLAGFYVAIASENRSRARPSGNFAVTAARSSIEPFCVPAGRDLRERAFRRLSDRGGRNSSGGGQSRDR